MKFDDVQPELLQAWQNDPVTRAFVEWLRDSQRIEMQGVVSAVRAGNTVENGRPLAPLCAGAYSALGIVVAKIEVKR